MNAPELTPDDVFAIKVWLGVACVLIAFVALPFVFSWWLERENKRLRSAQQFYCHHCRRGTDWSEDKSRCLECTPQE